MTDLRKAAKEALWAFQYHIDQTWPTDRSTAAIAALRAALAQQDEPVEEHKHWCASLTQLLLSDPPKRAPCDCKKKQAEPVKPVATLTAQRDALLEALKDATKTIEHLGYPLAAIERARAAIKAVEEPVAWSFEARHIDTAWGSAVSLKHPGREHKYMRNVKPLYLAPPQRKPLTEEEINALELPPSGTATVRDLVRLIERAHGIGETK